MPGGGVLPIMAYTGRLRPKKGYLFHASGYPFIYFVPVYKGNLSFGSVKGPKGLTDEIYGFIKSRKRSIFVTDSYLNDSAFTTVKEIQSSKQGM